MAARDPDARARHARAGLRLRGHLERGTQAMLLRQLYMALYETRKFKRALAVAEKVLALKVMVDVAHQDAARAAMALGQGEDALGHLRLAARRGPPDRRAFHLGTLGATLHVLGRYREAIGCLERASQWATSAKALYQAHEAVARLAQGEVFDEARARYRALARHPSAQGYGRFVLGCLAYHLRRWDDARRLLTSFVRRSVQQKPVLQLSLAGEVAVARALLEKMRTN